MNIETWPKGYIPVAIAYQRAVETLAPEARPSDEYLDALRKAAPGEAWTWIDAKPWSDVSEAYRKADAFELKVETLFREALATGELQSFAEGAELPEQIRNPEVWRTLRIEWAASFDNSFASAEDRRTFVEERQFELWLESRCKSHLMTTSAR